MGADGYWTYRRDHVIMFANVKLLCSTLETNIILYINYVSLFKNLTSLKYLKLSFCFGTWGNGKWLVRLTLLFHHQWNLR